MAARLVALWILSGVTVAPVMAATHVVRPDGSGDCPAIQAAINNAAPGDTVLLANGTFSGAGNWDLDFLGKAITVRSESENPDSCVIDCDDGPLGEHRGVFFQNAEGPSSVLKGVKIVNGSPSLSGGAVRCANASPTIISCIFSDNTSPYAGGGVYIDWNASATLVGCAFMGNTAAQDGGGLRADGPSVRLVNCTFVGNSAPAGGGVSVRVLGEVLLENTVAAFNNAGAAITCAESGSASLVCCNLFGNVGGDWVGCVSAQSGVNGNVSLDPLFCNAAAGNLHLRSDSPCAPEGSGECGLVGAWPVGCPAPTGACCFLDGTCQVLTEYACTVNAGLYQGGDASCDPNPCPVPEGSCCLPAGACLVAPEGQCTGVWTLHGGCDPNPCVLGACCSLTACVVLSETSCPGHFAGYLTTCEPNPCASAVDEGSQPLSLRVWAAPTPGSGPIVIRYQIPVTSPVRITIFDAAGAVVRRLADRSEAVGQHSVTWDGCDESSRDVPAGIYLVHLQSAAGEAVGRVVKTQ